MEKILVVEDDTILNKTLSYNLNEERYMVISKFTAISALESIAKHKFDLIILDVNLPDKSGFDLCKKIKENYDIPIIFLTANDMDYDMIKGYELGALDYITKPFNINVFKQKVRALLKHITTKTKQDCYDDGHLKINFSELSACINGNQIVFTPLEYRTLKLFIENPKNILTRKILLEKLWDIDANFVDEHTLTSVISRIRSKIEKDDSQYIKTVYGMGYMWIGEKNEF
ncbi:MULTISPECIES: response regulator transcription factor [unclassified Clostridioides]|uniref:response regulator transcription factor n=1 Tax=unclassified Clostridioides TaxID=2635829 RepID=UPI001D103700|nr:response regulator transcription factor [Clostridioides sp. ZZV14-6150]MCC0658899.1 response regulator transcription factor [Clostridioides sp. ZZV14-6154]MCC0667750.1 response regulator transcription factor [Clostridioides sp. ZZV14-6153]MCC0718982.1 response regulator transcription factor [Clostridioides sp. ZZV14-6105]MCC0721899.1 response regulator transcription factor [Clostridioides sp. ZZV14-6104]MCC0727564.1 response regulator transcription factor [Clostridioides sp. ZZV14-6045]MCC